MGHSADQSVSMRGLHGQISFHRILNLRYLVTIVYDTNVDFNVPNKRSGWPPTKFQIFFVLRKKESQVTFLHLYHHSLTPLETWICVKFIAGGHGTLGNLINNAVHVIMYTYYMVSAMGPEYQKYLWWKKHLTTVQLVSKSFRKYSSDLLFSNILLTFLSTCFSLFT